MPEISSNAEFPVPVTKFLETVRATPDEVWGKLLVLQHGTEKHTATEWKALLTALSR